MAQGITRNRSRYNIGDGDGDGKGNGDSDREGDGVEDGDGDGDGDGDTRRIEHVLGRTELQFGYWLRAQAHPRPLDGEVEASSEYYSTPCT